MVLSKHVLDVVVLAFALALDAMAVAAASATANRNGGVRLALVFGVFHFAMAGAGCGVGVAAEQWIAAWDHWLVFGVLVLLGGKLIVSAIKSPEIEEATAHSWTVLLALGLVTSVDAIAAGVTLPLLDPPRLLSIGTIAGVAAAMALVGHHAGARIGAGSRVLQVVGGLALIGIGAKTLVQHLAHHG